MTVGGQTLRGVGFALFAIASSRRAPKGAHLYSKRVVLKARYRCTVVIANAARLPETKAWPRGLKVTTPRGVCRVFVRGGTSRRLGNFDSYTGLKV
jgi:hypothetical protein